MSLDGLTSGGTREWVGWLALTLLVGGFGFVMWWLFFSPLPSREPIRATSRYINRSRRALATLVLLSGVLFNVGARWDELWHRMYGGFGDDFLWPPHLLMYAALGMNGAFALMGLTFALRGQGGLRERFRAEPLMGLLGLISAYQIASIPSDLLWHEIIGPDLTAWSLPHLLLALTSSAALLTGVAIALSVVSDRSWRGIVAGLEPIELVALALVGTSTLLLLQLATTEWEWTEASGAFQAILLQRPVWAYPVATLVVGVTSAHFALYTSRRIGAATAVAVGVLLAQVLTIAVYRVWFPPGPLLVSHLLLIPSAVGLDVWYALRAQRVDAALTRWAGAALYAMVYFAIAFPYLARVLPAPRFDMMAQFQSLAVGLPAAVVVTLVVARLGTWLGLLGRSDAEEPVPQGLTADVESAW